MNVTYFPNTKQVYGLFLGYSSAEDVTDMETRLHRNKDYIHNPFVLISAFLELEQKHRFAQVDHMVDALETKIEEGHHIFQHRRGHRRSPAENMQDTFYYLYTRVGTLRTQLNVWKSQLAKLLDCKSLHTIAPLPAAAGFMIQPEDYIKDVQESFEGSIMRCENVLQSMSLAFQKVCTQSRFFFSDPKSRILLLGSFFSFVELADIARNDANVAISDAKQMKAIAVLTMVFLPATAVAMIVSIITAWNILQHLSSYNQGADCLGLTSPWLLQHDDQCITIGLPIGFQDSRQSIPSLRPPGPRLKRPLQRANSPQLGAPCPERPWAAMVAGSGGVDGPAICPDGNGARGCAVEPGLWRGRRWAGGWMGGRLSATHNMARDNLSIVLAERPKADIIPGETFNQKTTKAPSPSDLQDGQILVENLYLSLDPAMRGWVNDKRSYLPPVQIGETMRGACACRVLASRSAQAKEGDFVVGFSGWTEFAILPEGRFEPASNYPSVTEPQDLLSALGMTGLTAWWGMTQIGEPKPGELVVVSGAAGATGSVAGQIAKIKGARVVGICGSEDKCKWLTEELGFDVALNYKAADFKETFKEATKDFIDVYYDNVGGEILDMCLLRAKEHARFVECGNVSQYNSPNPQGPKNFSNIVAMRIRCQGFIVFDHADSYPKARKELAQWIAEGKLKKNETIIKGGLKNAEQGLVDLYKGVNTGKLLVEIKSPNDSPSKLHERTTRRFTEMTALMQGIQKPKDVFIPATRGGPSSKTEATTTTYAYHHRLTTTHPRGPGSRPSRSHLVASQNS
ncbi:hypothetical protein G7046_g5316 [Stylonectria norvegica]|nr:hypothetical protein G7046_g5316 [Stylonectria norvegica]